MTASNNSIIKLCENFVEATIVVHPTRGTNDNKSSIPTTLGANTH